ncbi:TssN family type VI secretion system protein [Sphingobacterium sp. BIGb0165]|uniref:TssN family type VI secretion system protein n=1 Tax=Sphingobacterium sp. BIGb0165 TaxID=2940615 RepID=UPI002168469E|nr:TssN family type VI secretion system protein [Sphingobacterium sp. BIGb0165]MCS4225976.1 hypothetical protein [Sphingobacterium sp. BIGb0165]
MNSASVEMEVQTVFLRYILAPLLVFISAIVMSVWNKKNSLLSNKKLIISILLGGLALALPGFFGFLGFAFMPWGYFMTMIYAFGVGVLWVYLLSKWDLNSLENRKVFVFFVMLIMLLLGLYIYKLFFDWMSPFRLGWWAATSVSIFFVPMFFWWTYIALLSIPMEIHRVWEYPRFPEEINLDHLDFDKLLVLELELYKDSKDVEPLRVKVKAPEKMNFGLWFQKFIEDYNSKFPNAPVRYSDIGGEYQKWIFVVKRSVFKRNVYIDPSLDISGNQITEKMTIHAKRVSETIG